MRAATRFLTIPFLFVALVTSVATMPPAPAMAQVAQPIRVPSEGGARDDGISDRDLQCLAKNIYWEAGGESDVGKAAVAAVTLNRANHPRYPGSVCGVVYQNVGRSCQFSWACNAKRNKTPTGLRWRQSVEVAERVLSGDMDDPTGGALYFHGTRERPSWSRTRLLTTRLGGHIFYR